MDTLILSVSAGGGHVHAAEAIKEYILIDDNASKVKIVDTLKYINPLIDRMVIGSYLKTIKISPYLFGKLYNYAEKDEGIANFSNKFNELLADKILKMIKEFNPKLIITTHPFPSEMVTILKRKGLLKVPLLTILTDYAPHSFWIREGIDAYVVSNRDMKEEMIARGVNENIIYDIGIPVLPSFIESHHRTETLNSLDLDNNKKTLLVMGGSLGIGKISEIYKELSSIDLPLQIIAITGNNKRLYNELMKHKGSSSKPTRIIGYTKDVTKYMQCSDLLLTKPGGLTITEALICSLPIAIFCPIPGQEQKNADFLLNHKLAINLGDGKSCKNTIKELLCNEVALREMKENCSHFSKPNCGLDLINVINLILKKFPIENEVAAEKTKDRG